MLLAEELLLLVTDDTSGRLSAPAPQVDVGLGGANLIELTLMNKVDISGGDDPGRRGRIVIRDRSPAGDQVLDAALQTLIAREGKKPAALLQSLGKNLPPPPARGRVSVRGGSARPGGCAVWPRPVRPPREPR